MLNVVSIFYYSVTFVVLTPGGNPSKEGWWGYERALKNVFGPLSLSLEVSTPIIKTGKL